MPEDIGQNRLFRFGIFEFDGGTGELRRDGKLRSRLQGQPRELLLELIARPGEVVTREELRKRLWPADTFVDYDHSLNTAVNKLRDALSDSAENPRFIQTLPRQGYRFIAPVEVRADTPGSQNRAAEPASADHQAASDSESAGMLSDPRDLPVVRGSTVKVLFSLIQIMYLGFYIALLADLHVTQALLAEFLPDAKWIFTVWVVAAAVGIPVRLYLLSASLFGYRGLGGRFRELFPAIFLLDELWAVAPFLLVDWIGTGLALGATGCLLFLPFSQRSLLLMGQRDLNRREEQRVP